MMDLGQLVPKISGTKKPLQNLTNSYGPLPKITKFSGQLGIELKIRIFTKKKCF